MAGTLKHITGDGRTKFAIVTETSSTAAEPNVEYIHEVITFSPSTSGAISQSIFSDARVGTGRTFYPLGFQLLNGASAHGAANFTLEDTAGTAYITTAATNTLGSAGIVNPWTASVTVASVGTSGMGSGKGMNAKLSASSTGSAISVALWGLAK